MLWFKWQLLYSRFYVDVLYNRKFVAKKCEAIGMIFHNLPQELFAFSLENYTAYIYYLISGFQF